MKLEGKPEYEVIQRDAGPAPNSTGGKNAIEYEKRSKWSSCTTCSHHVRSNSKGATEDRICNGTSTVQSEEDTNSRGREPEEEAGSSVRVAKAKGLYQRQGEKIACLQKGKCRVRFQEKSMQEHVSRAESAGKLREQGKPRSLKKGWVPREETKGADLKKGSSRR